MNLCKDIISSRNFPSRLDDGANVCLVLAELAAVGSILAKLPTPAEYMEWAKNLDGMSSQCYRRMNFDQITSFQELTEDGERDATQQ
jgi:aconitate hydratase 2/2-methylisocitrate dehydratase